MNECSKRLDILRCVEQLVAQKILMILTFKCAMINFSMLANLMDVRIVTCVCNVDVYPWW